MLENQKATQKSIDQATDALKKAVKALEKENKLDTKELALTYKLQKP